MSKTAAVAAERFVYQAMVATQLRVEHGKVPQILDVKGSADVNVAGIYELGAPMPDRLIMTRDRNGNPRGIGVPKWRRLGADEYEQPSIASRIKRVTLAE